MALVRLDLSVTQGRDPRGDQHDAHREQGRAQDLADRQGRELEAGEREGLPTRHRKRFHQDENVLPDDFRSYFRKTLKIYQRHNLSGSESRRLQHECVTLSIGKYCTAGIAFPWKCARYLT